MTDFKDLQIRLPERVATNFGREKRSLRERQANYKSPTDRISRAIEKDGGRYVAFSDTEYGLLVCGVEYRKTLNFVYIDKDRQICCKHHDESYRLLKDIPAQLSVLNYIYTRQRAELKEYLDQFFADNDQMTLVTPVAIRMPRPKSDGDRRQRDDRKDVQKKNATDSQDAGDAGEDGEKKLRRRRRGPRKKKGDSAADAK